MEGYLLAEEWRTRQAMKGVREGNWLPHDGNATEDLRWRDFIFHGAERLIWSFHLICTAQTCILVFNTFTLGWPITSSSVSFFLLLPTFIKIKPKGKLCCCCTHFQIYLLCFRGCWMIVSTRGCWIYNDAKSSSSISLPSFDPILEHIFSHLVQLLLRVRYILSTENHSVPVVINKEEKRKWLGWVSLALYNASNICHRRTGRLPRRHGTNNKNNKVVCTFDTWRESE